MPFPDLQNLPGSMEQEVASREAALSTAQEQALVAARRAEEASTLVSELCPYHVEDE